MRYAAGFIVMGILFAGFGAHAEDPDCVRIDCIGKCMSHAEADGKAIPMLCMQAYTCYQQAECTKLSDGKCGWKQTPALSQCLEQKQRSPLAPAPQ